MYEYITQFVRYSKEEDLMSQLNDAARHGWEVLTVYPQAWRPQTLSSEHACTGVMVVYRRPAAPVAT